MAPVSYSNVSIGRNVCHFNDVSWGLSEGKALGQLNATRQALLRNNISKSLAEFQSQDLVKFERRVTALSWHPKVPYLVSAACKGGAIILGRGHKGPEDEIRFMPVVISEGTGPGGAIFSLKFDEIRPNGLYTAGLSGLVQRLNLLEPGKPTFTYDNTNDWNIWYTGMDVNFNNNILAAGDNKGIAKLFDVRSGTTIQKLRLHKSKIHHCEFNKRDSNLLATGALDERNAVCIWDLRNLKKSDTDVKAVKYFDDFKGANVASFSMDGSRLLVNDQKDQIKVYQGPMWTDVLTINHPHRQFQHLTAMEASWHPFDDVIIIGKYPKVEDRKAKPPPRPIEFFDGQTGDLIHSLYHPANGIVSLNAFNPTGDVMASGMGSNVLLWQSTKGLAKLSEPKKGGKSTTISTAMLSAIRGIAGAGESGSDEEDDVSETKKVNAAKRKTGSSAVKKSQQTIAKLKSVPVSKSKPTKNVSVNGSANSKLTASRSAKKAEVEKCSQEDKPSASKASTSKTSGTKVSTNKTSGSTVSTNKTSGSTVSTNKTSGSTVSTNKTSGSTVSTNKTSGSTVSTNKTSGSTVSTNKTSASKVSTQARKRKNQSSVSKEKGTSKRRRS